MQAALDATADLSDGFLMAGFSNGAGMAEHVALHRPVAAAMLFSGAMPLPFLGADAWPAVVPVQLHYAVSDPNRNQEWVDQFLAAVRASGADAEFHEYVASGHLFKTPPGPTCSTRAPRRICGPTCTTSFGTFQERPTSVCRAERRSVLGRSAHGRAEHSRSVHAAVAAERPTMPRSARSHPMCGGPSEIRCAHWLRVSLLVQGAPSAPGRAAGGAGAPSSRTLRQTGNAPAPRRHGRANGLKLRELARPAR